MTILPHQQEKIYIFHTEFLYLRGGEKYIYELTKRLVERYTITLCVENINSYWEKQFINLHIPIYHLWRPKHLYWLLLPLSYIINYLGFKKTIHNTDTVFATSFPLSFLATIITAKSVVFCFEPLSIFYDALRMKTCSIKEKLFLSVIKYIYAPIDAMTVKRARILATLNKPVAAAILKRYHRIPDVFIPNGVDTKKFSPSLLRQKVVKTQYKYVIGHSTDFTVLKGTEFLLRALPLVLKKQKSVLILISESIPNKKALAHYRKLITLLHIQNHVQFVGCVPEELLPQFYRSCDCFCYVGSTQCVGGSSASLSVIEAEACAIPVLRTHGNDDEIISKKTGFYFPSETPSDIAKVICSYLALPPSQKLRLQRNARQHVIKKFSWDNSIQRFVSIV